MGNACKKGSEESDQPNNASGNKNKETNNNNQPSDQKAKPAERKREIGPPIIANSFEVTISSRSPNDIRMSSTFGKETSGTLYPIVGSSFPILD